jgi:hypothetical protein
MMSQYVLTCLEKKCDVPTHIVRQVSRVDTTGKGSAGTFALCSHKNMNLARERSISADAVRLARMALVRQETSKFVELIKDENEEDIDPAKAELFKIYPVPIPLLSALVTTATSIDSDMEIGIESSKLKLYQMKHNSQSKNRIQVQYDEEIGDKSCDYSSLFIREVWMKPFLHELLSTNGNYGTEISLRAAVHAAANGKAVIYIDCNNRIASKRVRSECFKFYSLPDTLRGGEQYDSNAISKAQQCLCNIKVVKCFDVYEVGAALGNIGDVVRASASSSGSRKNKKTIAAAGLVVLDSLSDILYPYAEYNDTGRIVSGVNRSIENYASMILVRLKKKCQEYSMSALVLQDGYLEKVNHPSSVVRRLPLNINGAFAYRFVTFKSRNGHHMLQLPHLASLQTE